MGDAVHIGFLLKWVVNKRTNSALRGAAATCLCLMAYPGNYHSLQFIECVSYNQLFFDFS